MRFPRWLRVARAFYYRAKFGLLHYRKPGAWRLLFAEYVEDDSS